MIRVLQILPHLHKGGAEATVMHYYRQIDKTKVQFDFLLIGDHPKSEVETYYYEEEARSMGAKIFRIPIKSFNPFKFSGYPKIILGVLKENPEIKVVHCHQSAAIVPAIIGLLAMFSGIKIRIAHSHTPHLKKKKTLKSRIEKQMKLLLRGVTTEWAACSEEAGVYTFGEQWRTSERRRLITNARVLSGLLYNEQKRKEIREALELDDYFVVSHVGRISKAKNHPFLLNTFKELVKIDERAVLLLIGDGEDRAKIETLVKTLELEKQVRFLGWREDIPLLLQGTDVFAMPSHREGLSGAAIEAQAAGLPCVFSDTVSPEVKITENVAFLPIGEGQEKLWAQKIYSLKEMERVDTFEQVRRAGYDIQRETEKLQALYLRGKK